MNERDNATQKNVASPLFIRITGYLLFALAGIACLLCLCFGFRQGVYKEELQTQGMWLMIASLILALLFLPIWWARRNAIAQFLLDEYGEECCTPVKHPVIERETEQKKPSDAETP